MTHYLPGHILDFFNVPELEHVKDIKKPPKRKPYTGVSEVLALLQDESSAIHKPPVTPVPMPLNDEIKEKRNAEKEESFREQQKTAAEKEFDPKSKESVKGKTRDAYRTLFVGRLAYDVSKRDLRKKMEEFGSVKDVVIVRAKEEEEDSSSESKEPSSSSSTTAKAEDKDTGKDKDKEKEGASGDKKKPRPKSMGYAFVEFASERGFMRAYEKADGMKIGDRRIVVDVERGRTVEDWLPARFAGGLGKTRDGKRAKYHMAYTGRYKESAEQDFRRREARKKRKLQEEEARRAKAMRGGRGGRGGMRGGMRGGRGGFGGDRGGGFDRRDDRRGGGGMDRRDDRRGVGPREDRRDSRPARSLMDRGRDDRDSSRRHGSSSSHRDRDRRSSSSSRKRPEANHRSSRDDADRERDTKRSRR
jgi:U1 small nuclear ribonucleoprotein